MADRERDERATDLASVVSNESWIQAAPPSAHSATDDELGSQYSWGGLTSAGYSNFDANVAPSPAQHKHALAHLQRLAAVRDKQATIVNEVRRLRAHLEASVGVDSVKGLFAQIRQNPKSYTESDDSTVKSVARAVQREQETAALANTLERELRDQSTMTNRAADIVSVASSASWTAAAPPTASVVSSASSTATAPSPENNDTAQPHASCIASLLGGTTPSDAPSEAGGLASRLDESTVPRVAAPTTSDSRLLNMPVQRDNDGHVDETDENQDAPASLVAAGQQLSAIDADVPSEGTREEPIDTQRTQASHISEVLLEDGAYGRLLRLVAGAKVPFDLRLPKIVVVGSESHGKSSLLERLAMREAFPRGEDFTTRMPVRMRMRHLPENVLYLRHVRSGGDSRVIDGHETRFELSTDASDDAIADRIATMIQNFIVSTHGADDGRSILTDQEIEVEIRAENVPDLELIDLPGLVATPPNVAAASLELTQRFLRDPDTLALCVVEDPGAAVRAAPVLGEVVRLLATGLPSRTIVVLTKVEVSTQNPARLARRLHSPVETLGFQPKAIIPVINRGQKDGKSLSQAFDEELVTFARWRQAELGPPVLPTAECLGLSAVLRSLNELVEEHMVRAWVPQQHRIATQHRDKVRADIVLLGVPLDELSLADFWSGVCARIRAVLESDDFAEVEGEAWLWMADVLDEEPAAPAERVDRVQLILQKSRAESSWRALLSGVPVHDLLRDLIAKALSSSGLPLKLDRLHPRLHTMLVDFATQKLHPAAMALATECVPGSLDVHATTFGQQSPYVLPAHYSPAFLRNAAINVTFEKLLLPLVDTAFWTVELALDESPEVSELRADLYAQDEGLQSLITELQDMLPEARAMPSANLAVRLVHASQDGDAWRTRALLEAKATVDQADDEDGETVLRSASSNGHIECVRALIEAKATVDLATQNGWTALMSASQDGHIECVRALIEAKAKVDQADEDGDTALITASENGHIECVRALIEAKASVNHAKQGGWTALFFASQNGHDECVRALIEAKASVNHARPDGWTALMSASQDGHIECVRALIEAKAKVDLADEDGDTALITANQDGHIECMRALIEAKASVNHARPDGWTALMFASRNGRVACVRALLEAKADFHLRGRDGRTALDIARFNRENECEHLLASAQINVAAAAPAVPAAGGLFGATASAPAPAAGGLFGAAAAPPAVPFSFGVATTAPAPRARGARGRGSVRVGGRGRGKR